MAVGAATRFTTGLDVTADGLNSLDGGGNVWVAAVGGLKIDVSAMRVRQIQGAVADMDYAGVTEQAVTANQTNYVYLDEAAGVLSLVVNTTGFPAYSADQTFVPLATVVCDGSGVTGITDKRIRGFIK